MRGDVQPPEPAPDFVAEDAILDENVFARRPSDERRRITHVNYGEALTATALVAVKVCDRPGGYVPRDRAVF